MKLGEIIIGGRNAPERSVIYIIKCGAEILYIGKSRWVENRLAQHLGYSDPPSGGYFDEAARAAIPQCWDWEVEFLQYPEDLLISGNEAGINYWIAKTESSMIHALRPKYNIHYNW